jgi:DNA-binding protein Fis
MRAVVLAESVKIGPVELEFQDPPTSGLRTKHACNPSPSSPQDSVQETDPWDGLKQSLSQEIDRITAEEAAYQPPVGKWLHEDMVLEASRSAGNITTRAAELLGIPETTFRRKLKIANSNIAAGISSRPADWEEIHHNITVILESGNPDQVDLLEQARSCILETLAEKVPGNIQAGAALMGITETTFKKWLPEETS